MTYERSGQRLLAVHAHPDDESSKGAGTSARYAAEGARVVVVSATGGEAGDVLNPGLAQRARADRDIAGLRRDEMTAAQRALGVEHVWLGFRDSGLPEGDPLPALPELCFATVPLDDVVAPLVRLIRRLRPQVVTTYDENGGYPHPDHIRTHEATMAAVDAARDAGYRPELGAPWDVQKVYYNADMSKTKALALDAALTQRGIESPYARMLEWWAAQESALGERPAGLNLGRAEVDVADYLSVRDEALLAHASQVDPHGSFFAVPLDVMRAVWPHEDFTLAVDATGRRAVPTPETDLFDGVRLDAAAGGAA